MKRGLHVAVVSLLLAFAASAGAVDLDEAQLQRYHALTAELRCLICQNRSIAESDAPLAKDLKDIVARQIAAGRSDAQIKQYLVDRYGEWVLYDPPFDYGTLVLWLGPFALLLLGLGTVVWLMRRQRAAPAPSEHELDRERLARVLAESGSSTSDEPAEKRTHDDESRS